jgi:putative ABC transport system substrate-binding protein
MNQRGGLSMHRREFIAGLGSSAAWPLVARAQQPALRLIGVLNAVSAAGDESFMPAIRRGLGETGFVEGRNVAIVYRWADGQFERLPAMAADLVDRRVSVILTGGSVVAVRAAMAATRTIPIVFTIITDPVANGLVASLDRPGGNVTGITGIVTELMPKIIELLHKALPSVRKIALLVNPDSPANAQPTIEGAKMAASRLALELVIFNTVNAKELEQAFEAAAQQRASAVFLNNAYLLTRPEIAELSLRYALPIIGGSRELVTAGGGFLMTYGPNLADIGREAGIYVGRVLKGDKPGDLPVMQPTRFQLVVNLKTAKAMGLTIPESFLVRADEVIE